MALDPIQNYSSVSVPKVTYASKGSPGELYKVGDLVGTPGVEVETDGATADMIIRGNLRVKKVGAGLSSVVTQGTKIYATFDSSGKANNLTTSSSASGAKLVGYLRKAYAINDTHIDLLLWQS